jgi:hypothetical protein
MSRRSGLPARGTATPPAAAARRGRRRTLGLLAAVLATAAGIAVPLTASSAAVDSGHSKTAHVSNFDGLGVAPGTIKHVWLIILENKSYDASFTGLNNNTYLWQTLPSQGVLLKNYFGTGHFSLDNYISMASGQATQTDDQDDCPDYSQINGSVDTSGNLDSNPNLGQLASAAGPNAAAGQNGCVYPASVPTLFNQLDAAHVGWKGYAQDLGNADTGSSPHAVGGSANPSLDCGAPYASAPAAPDTTQPNPGSANATDQYVPKHFPFPWFESILQSGDCNSTHIANLFNPNNGLYHDLQNEATTPAFSWISPNNCSDGHDAVCHGNNLSGGFSDPNTPNAPANYTGGLYSADLFLEHVIPEIEASPAFKDGGLIDVTFDEAFPPFTYTGNSFANSTIDAPNYSSSLTSDSAGETLFGRSLDYEPTGPNTPLATDGSGNELYPGPGYNSYIDRPSTCVNQTVPPQPSTTCLLGGGSTSPGARTDAAATGSPGSSTITDSPSATNSGIQADDEGRAVTGTNIPAGAFVGQVTATPATATAASQSGGEAYTASFQLVDKSGAPLLPTGAVSGITLSAETAQTDPLFTATGVTNGGGDTGSVLISPDIKPGTTSTVYYNHYSWLRTMEDLFGLASTSGGLDGLGHIGDAAQPGLAPFGPDVFNNAPSVSTTGPQGPPGPKGAPGPRGPRGPAGKNGSHKHKKKKPKKKKHVKHTGRTSEHVHKAAARRR